MLYPKKRQCRSGILSKYKSENRVAGGGPKAPTTPRMRLGQTDRESQVAYRDFFRHELEPGEIDKIRKSTNGNFVLGSKRFEEEISTMLGRRVTHGKAGRPRVETIANKPKRGMEINMICVSFGRVCCCQ